MAGISSKAVGPIQNKEKTFQGQQIDDDLGLNWIQFKWRNHDQQIGRFIEIDPLSEKYEYNSTYAFSENKVTGHVELEGLEAVPTEDKRPFPMRIPTYNPLAPLIFQGQANIKAENVRLQYNKDASNLNPNDKEGRTELKEKARANTPEPFKSIIEEGRPMSNERAKVFDPNFKGNATKTNVEVNEVLKTTGTLGKIFVGAAIVQSGVTIATSDNRIRETATEASGWAGAFYVGGQFATAGSTVGPITGFGAGLVGSTLGFIGGKKAGDAVANEISKPQVTQFPIMPSFSFLRLFF